MQAFLNIGPFIGLLTSISLVMLGSSFLGTIISVYADRANYSTLEAGLLTSGYHLGILISSLTVHHVLRLAGHIRAFATLTSIFSAAALGHAFFENFYAYFTLRFIEGVATCGLYVCVESWLNEQSDSSSRGMVMSAYTFLFFLAVGSAQYFLLLDFSNDFYNYGLASLILSLALVPVALTKTQQPPPPSAERMPLLTLWKKTPLSIVVAMTAGIIWASYFGLVPFLAGRIGLSTQDLAFFLSFPIFGIVLFQAPMGLIADRFDRRLLLTGLCFGTTTFAFIIMFIPLSHITLMLACVMIFGGFLGTLYPMAIAHASDRVENHTIPSAIGGILLLNSFMAAVGPLTAPAFMETNPMAGLFGFIAFCGAVATLFCLFRWRMADPVIADDVGDFQMLPSGPSVLAHLSTRNTDEQESFDFDGDGIGDGGPSYYDYDYERAEEEPWQQP